MESLTKVDVPGDELTALVHELLGERVRAEQISPLTDGAYNAAYAVLLEDGSRVVVKVAPPDDIPVLTHERGLMAVEVDFYRRAEGHIPAPRVIAADLSRRLIDRDVLVMSHLDGKPLSQVKKSLTRTDLARVRRSLGAGVAGLRNVTGERFGYDRQSGALSANTWSQAFALMVAAILDDAATYGVRLPRAAMRLPGLVARAAAELDSVETPTLVHFDLWDGNIFVVDTGDGGEFEALIDGERAFWGDPLAELVSTSLFGNPSKAEDFNAGYAEVAGAPPDTGDGARLRLALYRAYLDIIMLVEGAPRGYRGLEHRAVKAIAARDLARHVRAARRALH